jgi:alpha-tubulin suppressor-like RCC1 family protein
LKDTELRRCHAISTLQLLQVFLLSLLIDDGEMFVWGTGIFGEFIEPKRVVSMPKRVKDINIGSHVATAVDVSGHVWTWGPNLNGELGHGAKSCAKEIPSKIESLTEKIVH